LRDSLHSNRAHRSIEESRKFVLINALTLTEWRRLADHRHAKTSS